MKKFIGILFISVFFSEFLFLKADAVIDKGRIGEKYEKVQVYEPMKYDDSIEETLENDPIYKGKPLNEEDIKRIEESEKEKENYELLVPKTKDNYEVALSYEDGTYTFLGSSDTYENAVTMADLEENKSEVKMAGQVIVPTVINSKGNVVYATESIGRVAKKYPGTKGTSLSYVYSDSSMRNAYTYVNDGYISEVPIVKNNEKEAQVLVAGYRGWMNTDINRTTGGYKYPNRDLMIQPITYVTNPSYYTVVNGTLCHHITVSMTTPSRNDCTLTIGMAPSYLKEGQKYYSYDGKYFYDGSNGTADALRKLSRDLQSGTLSNAVNKDNPYYNYYSYLPFRSKTNYTADELNRYIDEQLQRYGKTNSVLKGKAQAFIDAQNKYGVNALISLGLSINESDWGTSDYARNRYNLFGINATDDNTNQSTSYYKSVEDCIDYYAKRLISNGYLDPSDWRDFGEYLGNKEFGVNVKYASDPYWADKAAACAFQADYNISGKNINASKDYNYYQLILNTSPSSVFNSSGNVLYNVLSTVSSRGTHVGDVSVFNFSPVKSFNGSQCYAINPEVTEVLGSNRFDGNYNWSVKGYVPISSVKLINIGKNYFKDEDVNMDTNIDTKDLSLVAKDYNKTSKSSSWNERYDINNDGIVDIYDIVRVASNL